MANEYHDAQGRFCSKGDMQNAIAKLTVAGDFDAATALIADLKAIEEKREKKKFTANALSTNKEDAVSDNPPPTMVATDERFFAWQVKGQLHRTDGPAVEWKDGSLEWYQHDRLHREDGPALETADGDREWWVDGELHRKDGPAVEEADGSRVWYQHGRLHRLDGPAIERASGTLAWWVNGKQLSEAEFNARYGTR